ncbi:MAG: GumC family protein [Acidobacteriaceae bacterium]
MNGDSHPETRSLAVMLQEYVSILRQHWLLMLLTSSAAFAVLATIVALLPSVFEATTTIMVDPQQIPDKYVSTTVIEDPGERLNLLTQEVLSTSRLEKVIAKLDLYPKLRAQKGRDTAVEFMRTKITIQTKHTSGSGPSAFTLTFESNSPTIAATTANELADTFIQKHLQSRQQQVQGTTAFLSAELAQTRTDLEKQEERISQYRMQHLGEMPEQMQANLQALAQLQVQLQSNADQLSRLDEERLVLERTPEADHAVGGAATPSPRKALMAQIAVAEAHLYDLESRYTQDHPDVVEGRAHLEQLRTELRRLSGGAPDITADPMANVRMTVLTRERARLLDDQISVTRKIRGYQAKVDAVPLRQEELSNLTRDYETSKEHYRSLLDKTYSAQMATSLEEKQQGERFQVLDRAQPPDKAVRPNRPRFLMGSALLSLLIGFGIALLRERSDPSVKTIAELTRLLGSIELLGTIPRIDKLPAETPRRIA